MKWLLIALFTVLASPAVRARSGRELDDSTHFKPPYFSNRHEASDVAWGRHRVLSQHGTAAEQYNVADDDPQQLLTLQSLYAATNGPSWVPWLTPPLEGSNWVPWLTPATSYCRWLGVGCCRSSPLTLVPCNSSNAVVVLNLARFGLTGQLPADVPALTQLSVLNLEDNPKLSSQVPDSWLPDQLLWLSVQNTSLVACTEDAAPRLPGACTRVPAGLQWLSQSLTPGTAIQCPALQLRSFQKRASSVPAGFLAVLTLPYPQLAIPGAVQADPSFFNGQGCTCSDGSTPSTNTQGQLECSSSSSGGSSQGIKKRTWIIIVVLVAVVPHILVGLAAYTYIKHKAYLHRLVRFKEAAMQQKRGKVPGTPGLVLQEGRGLVPLADTLVTWVCTDVSGSTALWEWDAGAMDSAIDMHNRTLRDLLYEFGGHEIRNEGDSFVISFHEALDGVSFCLKAQERLQSLAWPSALMYQPAAATATLGDLLHEPHAAGMGQVVMAGLRVRMGINTGMPEDVFVHDLTEHVDYRGQQYDLTAEICDLAKGGQILMGPKTYLSWMRSSKDQGLEHLVWTEAPWREGSQIFGGTRRNLTGSSSFRTAVLRRQLGVDSGITFGQGLGSAISSNAHSESTMHTRQDSPGEPPWHQRWVGKVAAGNAAPTPWPTFSPAGLRVASHGLLFSSWGASSSPTHSPSRGATATLDTSSPRALQTTDDPFRHSMALPLLSHHDTLRSSADETAFGGPAMGHPLAKTLPSAITQGNSTWQNPQDSDTPGGSSTPINSIPAGPLPPVEGRQLLTIISSSGTGLLDQVTLANRSVADYGDLEYERQVTTDVCVEHRDSWLHPDGDGRPSRGGAATGWQRGLWARCMECIQGTLRTGDDDIPWEADGPAASAMPRVPAGIGQAVTGVTIDMGYYEWDPSRTHRPSKAQHTEGAAQDGAEAPQSFPSVVHLVQVLPTMLAARALMFDWPIGMEENSHWEKVSPGFFDAPGSWSLIFPGMRDLMSSIQLVPERPHVALAFSSIDGIKEIAAINVLLAQETTALHNACVRETLSACSGYECKESEGAFVLAFSRASDALEWALTLQLALMRLPWRPDLLTCHELAGEVLDTQAQKMVFCGARARVGVFSGNVDRVTPHGKTGRADYFGQPVNRAARLMSAAHGGQVVCDHALMQQVFEDWATRYSAVKEPGEMLLQPTGPSAFLTAAQLASKPPIGPRASPKAFAKGLHTASQPKIAQMESKGGLLPTGGRSGRRTVSWVALGEAAGEPSARGTTSRQRDAETATSLVSEVRIARSFVGRSASRSRLCQAGNNSSVGGHLSAQQSSHVSSARTTPQNATSTGPPSPITNLGSDPWTADNQVQQRLQSWHGVRLRANESCSSSTPRSPRMRSSAAAPVGFDLGGLLRAGSAASQQQQQSRRASSASKHYRKASSSLSSAVAACPQAMDIRPSTWDPTRRAERRMSGRRMSTGPHTPLRQPSYASQSPSFAHACDSMPNLLHLQGSRAQVYHSELPSPTDTPPHQCWLLSHTSRRSPTGDFGIHASHQQLSAFPIQQDVALFPLNQDSSTFPQQPHGRVVTSHGSRRTSPAFSNGRPDAGQSWGRALLQQISRAYTGGPGNNIMGTASSGAAAGGRQSAHPLASAGASGDVGMLYASLAGESGMMTRDGDYLCHTSPAALQRLMATDFNTSRSSARWSNQSQSCAPASGGLRSNSRNSRATGGTNRTSASSTAQDCHTAATEGQPRDRSMSERGCAGPASMERAASTAAAADAAADSALGGALASTDGMQNRSPRRKSLLGGGATSGGSAHNESSAHTRSGVPRSQLPRSLAPDKRVSSSGSTSINLLAPRLLEAASEPKSQQGVSWGGAGLSRASLMSSNGAPRSPGSPLSSRTLEQLGLHTHSGSGVAGGLMVTRVRSTSELGHLENAASGLAPHSGGLFNIPPLHNALLGTPTDLPTPASSQSLLIQAEGHSPTRQEIYCSVDTPCSSRPGTRRASQVEEPSSYETNPRSRTGLAASDYASAASTSFSSKLAGQNRHLLGRSNHSSSRALGPIGKDAGGADMDNRHHTHKSAESLNNGTSVQDVTIQLRPTRQPSGAFSSSTPNISQQLPSMNVSSRRSTRNSGRPGSTRGSAVTSSLGGGRGATDAGVVSDEPAGAVIAECYKISKSPTLDEGVLNAMAANSITLIKYSRAVEASGELEEELRPVDEDEAMQPRAATIIPTVPVEVCVWSLGSFRLKGVTQLMNVVSLVPKELERRIHYLQRAPLNKGKARCVQRLMVREATVRVPLPDVSKLPCCAEDYAAPPCPVSMHRPPDVDAPPALRRRASMVMPRRAADGEEGGPTTAAATAALHRYNSLRPGARSSMELTHSHSMGGRAGQSVLGPRDGEGVGKRDAGAGLQGDTVLDLSRLGPGHVAMADLAGQSGHMARRSSAPYPAGYGPRPLATAPVEESLASISELAALRQSMLGGTAAAGDASAGVRLHVSQSYPQRATRLADLRPAALVLPESPAATISPGTSNRSRGGPAAPSSHAEEAIQARHSAPQPTSPAQALPATLPHDSPHSNNTQLQLHRTTSQVYGSVSTNAQFSHIFHSPLIADTGQNDGPMEEASFARTSLNFPVPSSAALALLTALNSRSSQSRAGAVVSSLDSGDISSSRAMAAIMSLDGVDGVRTGKELQHWQALLQHWKATAATPGAHAMAPSAGTGASILGWASERMPQSDWAPLAGMPGKAEHVAGSPGTGEGVWAPLENWNAVAAKERASAQRAAATSLSNAPGHSSSRACTSQVQQTHAHQQPLPSLAHHDDKMLRVQEAACQRVEHWTQHTARQIDRGQSSQGPPSEPKGSNQQNSMDPGLAPTLPMSHDSKTDYQPDYQPAMIRALVIGEQGRTVESTADVLVDSCAGACVTSAPSTAIHGTQVAPWLGEVPPLIANEARRFEMVSTAKASSSGSSLATSLQPSFRFGVQTVRGAVTAADIAAAAAVAEQGETTDAGQEAEEMVSGSAASITFAVKPSLAEEQN